MVSVEIIEKNGSKALETVALGPWFVLVHLTCVPYVADDDDTHFLVY